MYQLKGVIAKISEAQQISEKFTKREFWVRDDSSQYPQTINFQLSQDRCDLIDSFKEGDSITVNFNLRGRTWQSAQGEEKCFNTLDAWRLEGMEQPEEIPPAPAAVAPEGNDDDLPF
jgi:hypothetical protein